MQKPPLAVKSRKQKHPPTGLACWHAQGRRYFGQIPQNSDIKNHPWLCLGKDYWCMVKIRNKDNIVQLKKPSESLRSWSGNDSRCLYQTLRWQSCKWPSAQTPSSTPLGTFSFGKNGVTCQLFNSKIMLQLHIAGTLKLCLSILNTKRDILGLHTVCCQGPWHSIAVGQTWYENRLAWHLSCSFLICDTHGNVFKPVRD